MKRVVDASPVAVVKLLGAVCSPACHSAEVPIQVTVEGSTRLCVNRTK